ncbi:hypothetical protein [Salipaludibacillus sp. CF4.18]|uniref:Ger(x)C family spore germination protein n=1 Tax=Salipaludibacillus sp. CF4.18 TaxID=3373081 RepID=UPI003EE5C151
MIVVATGLDYHDEEEIEVSIEAKIPEEEGDGEGEQQTFVQSATGKTTAEAISHLQRKFPIRIFFGHNQVVVFSEQLVREKGIKDELVYFFHFQKHVYETAFLSQQIKQKIFQVVLKKKTNSYSYF